MTDPKLIFEVLSPGTRGYDQRDKFVLCRTLASLREYVLIDPTKRHAEVFTLGDGGGDLGDAVAVDCFEDVVDGDGAGEIDGCGAVLQAVRRPRCSHWLHRKSSQSVSSRVIEVFCVVR